MPLKNRGEKMVRSVCLTPVPTATWRLHDVSLYQVCPKNLTIKRCHLHRPDLFGWWLFYNRCAHFLACHKSVVSLCFICAENARYRLRTKTTTTTTKTNKQNKNKTENKQNKNKTKTETKQKTKQNETKQNKTKQNKTKNNEYHLTLCPLN